jgi:H+/Cl- antiporter ClcA
MTVSLCVIMLEVVKSEAVLPFLMVAIIVAKGTADRFGDSFVLRRIKLKRLPFLQRMPHQTMRRARFTAANVVSLTDHPLLPACVSPVIV